MTSKQTFIGDGTTTTFYFSFPFFGINDVHVKINNIESAPDTYIMVPTPTPDDADTEYTGGHVTFETAPAIDSTIEIYRTVELVRHIDYQPTEQPQSYQLNQDFNQCIAALTEMSENLKNALGLASIPNVSDLLSEISAIREQIPNFLTDEDLESLNTAVSNINNTISTLNGYDYVVESQTPTAENNYTWYRKYKSGWVEMGGTGSTTSATFTKTLPITMTDTNYTAVLQSEANRPISLQTKSTASITAWFADNTSGKYNWYVSGTAAQ